MRKVMIIIFILALFLRIFVVFNQDESKKMPRADAKGYDNIAMNIISGNGFSCIPGKPTPTAMRPPLYPLFLAGIYAVFGHNYMTVKIIQAILGALLCLIIFFITDAIYNDKRIAIIAAFLTALYKPFVSGFSYYGGPAILYAEYFYMFMLGLAVLMTVFFIKKESKTLGILSGIFIGLAILTRPEFALFPIVLAFYLFYASKLSIKRFIRKFFMLYFFIALTMAPWVTRNYIVLKRFIPLSTIGGLNFWVGNGSFARGGGGYPLEYKKIEPELKGLTEYEQNSLFLKKGIEELRNNMGRIPGLFIKKVLVHWAPFEEGFGMFNFSYAVIFLFASVGILFFRRNVVSENILFIIFLSTTLAALITYGEPRYRYTCEPYLMVFAALTINEAIKRLGRER